MTRLVIVALWAFTIAVFVRMATTGYAPLAIVVTIAALVLAVLFVRRRAAA